MAAGRRLCSPRAIKRALIWPALLLAALLLPSESARAQIGSERYSSIVIEAASGRVISAINPDEQRYPASLTKMMTLYMVFEALRDRRVSLTQLVPISGHAASMSPTKLGLVPGSKITVHEAILGLVTKSANDAAAALGEMLGGDEGRFGQMMTLRARALGMSRSVFHNASGLPDPDQWSTARDLATLGRRLVQDFPNEYRYFSTPSFRFRGRTILTHDRMLETYPGADGIKTGYTDASGFNLVTSAVRGNVRLIGVVLGAARAGERDLHMAALLDQGFEKLDVPMMARRGRQGGGLVTAAQAAQPPAPSPQASVQQVARGRPARWTVQVGSFASEAAARKAANTARRLAGSGEVRLEQATVQGKAAWRAQLTGLSETEARETCATLSKRKQSCSLVKPDPNQVASR
ncbi:D-alanyl-D-alanine carboxypeptidase family protein [Limobrevibacterium gyesilva]|uniref:D-alanyl-D-alanine carboxypeptidase n=1 Tax=Limobrevibacterium gyesilva TaxID=2991712 RepID=A0AA41YLI0_9PROT|nr:D-alanyl-D-alanine carboxypeptidase family protein [Limobrevibacterium gyesilva]MCW3474457.1 D-alanyl-D-alanine carboxypeptidase [Limobrevibacterium gyesilva]